MKKPTDIPLSDVVRVTPINVEIPTRTVRIGMTDHVAPWARLLPPSQANGDIGMSDYDTDIVLWSEHQAELLRRMGKGESVNDQVDWDNVAEEIEDMGNNVVRGVASHLVQALLHDLKAEAWPLSRDVPHWRAEARIQRDEARAGYAPSMARRDELKVDRLYRRALRGMPDTIDDVPPLPVPDVCPVTLDELLSDDPAA